MRSFKNLPLDPVYTRERLEELLSKIDHEVDVEKQRQGYLALLASLQAWVAALENAATKQIQLVATTTERVQFLQSRVADSAYANLAPQLKRLQADLDGVRFRTARATEVLNLYCLFMAKVKEKLTAYVDPS